MPFALCAGLGGGKWGEYRQQGVRPWPEVRLSWLCVQGPFAPLLGCAAPSGCLVPAKPYLGECGALRVTPKSQVSQHPTTFTTSSCSSILFWPTLPPALSFVLEVTGVAWPQRLCCLYVEIHAESGFPKLPVQWAHGTVFLVVAGKGHSHSSVCALVPAGSTACPVLGHLLSGHAH